MAAEAKEDKKEEEGPFPLIDETGCFYVSVGLAGEISSGKSTFLNAILGDAVAQANIGRTTTSQQRYYESISVDSNDQARNENLKANKINENLMKKADMEIKKFNKQPPLKRWFKHILGISPKKPKFYGTKTIAVTQSTLIPKDGDLDNTFVLCDFPGINDIKLDEGTFKQYEIEMPNLDYIIYVLDCLQCLRNKASEELFDKFINIAKTNLINSHLKLVVLFNKFDSILLRNESKKFVKEQETKIREKLTAQGIPNDKISFICSSATNLLIRKVLISKNTKFLEKEQNKTLLDEIYIYALNFIPGNKLFKVKQQPLDKQLEIICKAMESSDEIDDESKEIDNGNNKNMLNKLDIMNINSIDDILNDSMNFFKSLRDITILYKKAQKYLTDMNIKTFQETIEFFICVYCLVQKKDDNFKLENLMMEKLLAMADTLKNEIEIKNKCLIYCLNSLQFVIKKMKNFNWKELIKKYTLNKHINIALLDELLKNINNENKEYYYNIGKIFVDTLVDYYQTNNGNLNDIITVNDLVLSIEKYYHDSKPNQIQKLIDLLTGYPSAEMQGNSNAKDLMLFFFEMNVIIDLLGDDYDSYDILCSKYIKKKDNGFKQLLICLTKLVKPRTKD